MNSSIHSARGLAASSAPTRRIRWALLWLLGVGLLGVFLRQAAAETERPSVVVRDVEMRRSDEAQARRVALPMALYRESSDTVQVAFSGRFAWPAGADGPRAALFLPAMDDGGVVRVNGTVVGSRPQAPPGWVAARQRPVSFAIPPEVLRDDNVLEIEWVQHHRRLSLEPISVGEVAVVERTYAARYVWHNTLSVISIALGMVMAAYLLVLWLIHKERAHLALALSALGWMGVNIGLLMPSLPVPVFVAWRAALHLSVGLFALGLGRYVTLYMGCQWHGYWRAAWVYVFGLPIAVLAYYAVTGQTGSAWFKPRSELIAITLAAAPLVLGLGLRWRSMSAKQWLVIAVAMSLVVMGLSDVLQHSALNPLAGWGYSLHGGSLLWFSVVFAMTFHDHLSARQSVLRAAAETQRKLAQQEVLLHQKFFQQAEWEREHAASAERERLVREMHDGLGSQLISTLALCESGQGGSPQLADALRDCIEDLRLAMDSQSEPDATLAMMVASWRHRLQQRIPDDRVRLSWAGEVELDEVPLRGAQAMQVLRSLQEAVGNALRHAACTRLEVAFSRNAEGRLLASVRDDGKGFDIDSVHLNRGIRNVRARAQELGALVGWSSAAGGTVFTMELGATRTPRPMVESAAQSAHAPAALEDQSLPDEQPPGGRWVAVA